MQKFNDTDIVRRLFDVLEELVHAPGDWRSKRDMIRTWNTKGSSGDAEFEEFLGWFPEADGDE